MNPYDDNDYANGPAYRAEIAELRAENSELRREMAQRVGERENALTNECNASKQRLSARVAELETDLRLAFAIAGWHECRLAIVRRDGWEALKLWDAQNPTPGGTYHQ